MNTIRTKIRSSIGSAHALAFVAIFIALSGGAYAAQTATKNSVVSESVKDDCCAARTSATTPSPGGTSSRLPWVEFRRP